VTAFLTRPIEQTDLGTGFDCGVAELNSFFERHALSNHERGIGKTFVLAGQEEEPRVLGFYTLGFTTITAAELPKGMQQRLPRYPIPCALVGRLGVDRRAQGQKWGLRLLLDGLRRLVLAGEQVGGFAVVVDAKDEKAQAFYERFGFMVLDPAAPFPRRMLINMQRVRDALALAEAH
jgi:GNAT superfamily N-acetyltransferase